MAKNSMTRNRYLLRRVDMRMDGRNPYGSRGGYVSSRRGRRDNRDYGQKPMNFYGRASIMPMYDERDYNDYNNYNDNRDYRNYNDYDNRDYNDYADMDYAKEQQRFDEDLKHWIHKLKSKDKFGVNRDELISKAKQMGVQFGEYTEDEYLAVYYMLLSDFPTLSNEYHIYLSMAKQWLEDNDIQLSPSEKLATYYYEIVKA